MGGLGRHEDEQDQPLRPGVGNSMSLSGWRHGDLILPQFPFLLPDLQPASSLHDKVDLVRTFMGMKGLGLTRLEAIEVAKQPVGLKETVFFHLFRRKLSGLGNFPELFRTVLL